MGWEPKFWWLPTPAKTVSPVATPTLGCLAALLSVENKTKLQAVPSWE